MVIKRKILPKGLKQGVMPSYDNPQHEGDGFDFNDMIREVVEILDPERLRFRWDAIIGFNSFIVVCPTCNNPVEPVPVEPIPRSSNCVFFRDPKFHPTWVKCERCNVQYFLVELVRDRSFRQKFKGEKAVLIDLVR